jgi:hypothetical protein
MSRQPVDELPDERIGLVERRKYHLLARLSSLNWHVDRGCRACGTAWLHRRAPQKQVRGTKRDHQNAYNDDERGRGTVSRGPTAGGRRYGLVEVNVGERIGHLLRMLQFRRLRHPSHHFIMRRSAR